MLLKLYPRNTWPDNKRMLQARSFGVLIPDQGSTPIPAMIAFLTLALCVGPVMEEVVFRGYL
jgi:membrane protease YdiL (CAAX protease family)